jgi:hypothetical protein
MPVIITKVFRSINHRKYRAHKNQITSIIKTKNYNQVKKELTNLNKWSKNHFLIRKTNKKYRK